MIIFFIVGLLLGAVAVVFALQNIEVMVVSFFAWQFASSMAVILSLALLTGMVVALLLTLPELTTNYFINRALRKRNKELEEELRKQRESTVFDHIAEGTVIK